MATVDKFLQVSLFGCLGGKGAVVIATNMDAGIVSRHLYGHGRRWRTAQWLRLRHTVRHILGETFSGTLAIPYDIGYIFYIP